MNYIQKFKDYLLALRPTPSKVTVKNYSIDVKHFISWIETQTNQLFNPSVITPAVIEQFRKEKQNLLSARSLDRHISSLRKFFQSLKLQGIIAESPFEIIKQQQPAIDPFQLKNFKDFLYVYNASNLTIKNYIIDVKQFLNWAQEVAKNEGANPDTILSRIDEAFVRGYRDRLLREKVFSPASINRKLSSLRKYLSWAASQNLLGSKEAFQNNLNNIENVISTHHVDLPKTTISEAEIALSEDREQSKESYSSFPPFRVAQKLGRIGLIFFDTLITSPLTHLAVAGHKKVWSLTGKPLFTKSSLLSRIRTGVRVKNIPQSVFAPLTISTRNLPWHEKIIFHTKFTRPNWYKKYHSYAITHYFHWAILLIFTTAIGFGLYSNFVEKPKTQPILAVTAPPRILSFQGRLTDANNNPIASSTNLRFTVYNSLTASDSALLWQEVDNVTPDSNGVFSVLLGNSTTIPQSLFGNNAALYLGISVGQTPELTPRQQLATVAYATNAETLQGLQPITGTGNVTNVVLALDGSGNLTIGGSATPVFTASGGQFTLSGKTLTLSTVAGSNTNVQLAPDGSGIIDVQKPLSNTTRNNNIASAVGAVEVDGLFAVLATSSGQSAVTINQNSTGPLISASASGNSKFTVGNNGSITDSNYTTAGGIIYTDGTGLLLQTVAGTTGQCLTSAGGATPTWGTCGSGGSGFWTLANGSLYPVNTTLDVFVGGSSTTSANFAFINNAAGTPTASISGNITLNSAGIIQTTKMQQLTIGSATTGPIQLSPKGTTGVFIDGSGNVGVGTTAPASLWQATTSNADLRWTSGFGGITPSMSVINTTGKASALLAGSNGSLFSFDSAGYFEIAGNVHSKFTGNSVGDGTDTIFMHIANNGNVGIGSTNPGALLDIVSTSQTQMHLGKSGQFTSYNLIVTTGSQDTFTWQRSHTTNGTANVLTLAYDGTTDSVGIGSTNPYGIFQVNGAAKGKALVILNETGDQALFTASASGTTKFTIAHDGTLTATKYNTQAGLLYLADTAGTIAETAQGTTGQCLISNGTGAPSWATCASGIAGTNWWTMTAGAVYPINSSLDLLVGSSATTSAKFAVLNMATGTPTASVSSGLNGTGMYFDANGNIQTVNNMGMTIGGTTTGNIILAPLNSGAGSTVNVNAANLSTNQTSINVFNTTATTVNFAGAANNINVGNAGGTTTFRSATIDDNQATATLFGTPTTLTFGAGATTALNIGASNTPINLKGNVTLGTNNTNTITPNGLMNADLIPTGNGSINLGSSSHFYNVVYANSFSSPVGNGTSGFWTITNNTNLFPTNLADDLLIGGNATGSATPWQVYANSVGTIVAGTATSSGNLSFRGAATKINLLNGAVLDIQTSVGGDAGLASVFNVANNGNLTATGNLALNGGTLSTTQLTGFLFNTTTTTVNLAGGANVVNIGNASGTTLIRGNQTFGSAGTNTINVVSEFTSDLIPNAAATYNLGTSALTWNNLFLAGNYGGLWQRFSGVLSSTNITDDLAIGGTSTASAKFQIFGTTANATTTGTFVFNSGSQANNLIAARRNQGLTIGDSQTGNIIFNGGNVGIATTQPAYPLSISDNGAAAAASFTNTAATTSFLKVWPFTDGKVYLQAGATDTTNSFAPVVFSPINSSLAYLAIVPSSASVASVGINTSSPVGSFEVQAASGSNHDPLAKFDSAGASDSNSIFLANGSGTFSFFVAGAASAFMPGTAAGDGGARVNAGQKFFFGDSATTRMLIDSSSHVGIGTTTINATLDLGLTSGSNKIYLVDNGTDKYGFGATGGALQIYTGALSSTNFIQFGKYDGTTFTEYMRLNNSGNVGIGTTTVVSKLDLEGAVAGKALAIFNETGDQALFTASASGTPEFTIQHDGTINNSLIPSITDTYNLGSDPNAGGKEWNNLYIRQIITPSGGGIAGFWQLNSGVLAPSNIKNDVAIGGTATSSALFQIFANTGNATTAGTLTFTGSPATIQTTSMIPLTIGSATTGPIQLSPKGTTGLFVAGSGNVGVGTTNPIYPFQVLNTSVADQAPLVVFGDASSTTRYEFLADRGQGGKFLINSGSARIQTQGDLGFIGGTGTTSLYITNPVGNVGIGTTTNLGNAQLVVNQTNTSGLGDIFTASAAATTRFTIGNDGSTTITAGTTTANALAVTAASLTSGNLVKLTPPDPKVNNNGGVLLASANIINVGSTDHTYMTLTNQDLTVSGHKNLTTLANVQKVFVYDTSKDTDGGRWTNDDRAQVNSWYTEARTAADACVIGTNTRCGTSSFPRKAILVLTSASLYIFDAKDNSLWMTFNRGAGATFQMIGTGDSSGKSVFALNGEIYIGSTGGTSPYLFAVNFKQDNSFEVNNSSAPGGYFFGNKSIANRNTTVTFTFNANVNMSILGGGVNDISAAVINGQTFIATANAGGSGGGAVALNNESSFTLVGKFGTANVPSSNVWLSSTGTLYATVGDANPANTYALKVKYNVQNITSTGGSNQLFDVVYAMQSTSNYGVTQTDNNTFSSLVLYPGPTATTAAVMNPTSLYVTQGTSTNDGISNTVYIGQGGLDGAVATLQENQASPAAGTIKYFKKNFITEDMVGDIRGFWPMNEASGNLADASIKSNTLTASVSGITYGVSGVRGTAVTLDGLSGYFTCSNASCGGVNNLGIGQKNISAGAWFKTTSAATEGIIAKYNINSSGSYILRVSGGKAVFMINNTPQRAIGVRTVNDGNWHYMVGTFDGSNVKIYVDGQLDGIQPFTGTLDTSPADFSIGAYLTGGFYGNWFNGTIDEPFVSSTTLTASEVTHMYQVGYRALQTHSSQSIRGTTIAADGSQQLANSNGNVTAVAASLPNNQLYVGTNNGVSIIGLDSDTINDVYNNNITTTDDVATTWALNNNYVNSISVGQSFGNGLLLAFGSNNGGSGGMWMESQNTALKDVLATSYNPFGTNLTQSNLNVDTVLRVSNQISTRLDNLAINATSSAAFADAFRVDNQGNLLSRSLINTTTAMQFNDASNNTVLNIDTTNDRVGIGTTAPTAQFHIYQNANNGNNFILQNANAGGNAFAQIQFKEDTWQYNLGVASSTNTNITNDFALWDNNGGRFDMVVNTIGGVGFGVGSNLQIANSALVINQQNLSGLGDIISASASGVQEFTVSNAGVVTASSFKDLQNTAYFLDPAATGIALNIAGTAGIKMATPSASLDIGAATDNASTGDTLRVFDHTLSGYMFADYISIGTATPYAQIGSWSLQNAAFENTVIPGGNLGIGTTNPAAKLQVTGTNQTTISKITAGDTSFDAYLDDTAGNVRLGANSGGTNAKIMTFATTPSGGSLTERMRIDSTGNVGIGTSSPQTNLHLAVTSGTTTVRVGDNVTSGAASIQMEGNASQTNWEISSNRLTANALQFTPSTAVAGFTFSTPTLSLVGGNVGIGSTNPGSKLVIIGLPTAGGNSTVCNSGGTISINVGACGTSLRKYKMNITDFANSLSEVRQLRPVTYNWNPATYNGIPGDMQQEQVGFIAEEVNAVDPLFNTYDYNADGSNQTLHGVDYPKMSVLAIGAIQELANAQNLQSYTIATLAAGLQNVNLSTTGNLEIAESIPSADFTIPSYYTLSDLLGNPLKQISAISDAIIANLRAGSVQAQKIITGTLAITTNNVSIAGQSLSDYILGVVRNALNNGTLSPIASVDQIHTNLISPLASNSAIAIDLSGSQFTIRKSSTESAVASIDNVGNATFSGTLNSQNLAVNTDATIAGTLHVHKIVADDIVGLSAAVSTLSAQNITNVTNIYFATPSGTPNNEKYAMGSYASSSTASGLLTPSLGYTNVASYSSFLAYVPNLSASTATFDQGLTSLGPTALSDTTIVGQLSIGTGFVLANNSINVLGQSLEIQPLRQGGVNFEGGMLAIDTDGNLTVNGNAVFSKTLAAHIISPLSNNSDLTFKLGENPTASGSALASSNLSIQNASGSGIFNVDQLGNLVASGAANIAKLNLNFIQPALAVSDTEVVATGSAGTTTIKSHQTEVTIDNPLVTDKSLIYITPVGQSGVTPYLIRQVSGSSFTVGISLPQNVITNFNWLIVN